MKRPVLYINVGIPASGKSSWAFEQVKEGYHIHSSDEMRKDRELPPGDKGIFPRLLAETMEDLRAGNSCIYDSTNLTRKKRRAVILEAKKIGCEIRCAFFLTPVSVCRKRNRKRSGFARVPESVYDEMLTSFELPDTCEGFDRVEIMRIVGDDAEELRRARIPERDGRVRTGVKGWRPEDLMDFSQDNPHHAYSLGEHLSRVRDLMQARLAVGPEEEARVISLVRTAQGEGMMDIDHAEEPGEEDDRGNVISEDDLDHALSEDNRDYALSKDKPGEKLLLNEEERAACLLEAAVLHDIGKIFTKSFIDGKGRFQEKAHFIGHENYGTYEYLVEKLCREEIPSMILSEDERIRRVIYTANLINWHMRPLNVWMASQKNLRKERTMLDSRYAQLFSDILLLHACDVDAHD